MEVGAYLHRRPHLRAILQPSPHIALDHGLEVLLRLCFLLHSPFRRRDLIRNPRLGRSPRHR